VLYQIGAAKLKTFTHRGKKLYRFNEFVSQLQGGGDINLGGQRRTSTNVTSMG